MQLVRFLAPALVLSIAVVARADEAKTYDLGVKAVHKVGEILTATTHDESTNDTKVATAEGAVVFAKNEKEVIDFTATRKILEVDAEGRVTKELIHFSAWKLSKGEVEATDLAGVHVEVSGREAKRSWKLLTPGVTLATISDSTKEWLDKKHGPDEKGEFFDAIKPSKPVAIGETWEADLAKVVAVMGKEMDLDAGKSSAKATLVSVEGDLATVHVELKLQVVSFPAGPGQVLKVIEGGLFEIAGEGHAPLAASARGDGGSMTMKLVTKTEAPQNMTAAIAIEGKMNSSTTIGGEMPEIPVAK